MKYALIIPDGAADEPLPQLDGRTPLQAAHTPHLDALAAAGRLGLAATVPEGFESGSDVATLSLLGYDPAVYHTGRAPLEAAAQGIPLAATDWVFRCNLVTVIDGVMKDHSAGGISDADARSMLRDLARAVQYPGMEFFPGVSYRNLLVYRGQEAFDVKTRPPHEIPNQPIEPHLPDGPGSSVLRSIMTQSRRMFDVHEINDRRTAAGKNPATQVWLWGQGHPPAMPRFVDRFGVHKAAMITGVDLLRGIAKLLGWDVIEVPGMTSFHDTDYAAQGIATAKALDTYDLIVSHVESPDEASHQADWQTKVAAIEAIDRHVVGPVVERLKRETDWRILVLPDHPTNIATRKHGYAPTPWVMAGSDIKGTNAQHSDSKGSDNQATTGATYDEASAGAAGATVPGHELMGMFLGA